MSHSLPLITSTELMSPTLNILPPSLYISLSLPLSGSMSHKGTPQFHLKWRWSHFRKILETFSLHTLHGYLSRQWEDSLPIIRNYSFSAALWVCFADCFRLLIDCTSCRSCQLKARFLWKHFSRCCTEHDLYPKIHLSHQLKMLICMQERVESSQSWTFTLLTHMINEWLLRQMHTLFKRWTHRKSVRHL